ncbi:uncharacterized protein P884DRAFT_265886 [Thermothelomyces heterothallicus CBS 202.75]|uniref:uncharacterized protein n=1 Tax=Thermothelomyces heterothallicus CBS 202.75 TaxID=1149848 RepID=UPI00374300F5
MEHAGLSVDSGPPDQLDLGFQLDLKANAEHDDLDAKRYDLGLDRSYEDPEQALPGEDPEDAYEEMEQLSAEEASDDVDAEPELDLTVSEAHQATASGEHIQNTELADSDARDNVEYQDEIGYEDDDHLATGVNAGESNTEAGEADGGLPSIPSETHLEAASQTDDSHHEASIQENDESWNRGDIDLEPHNENTESQGSLSHTNEAEPSEHEQGGLDPVDEFTPEQCNADHYDGNLEEELETLAHTVSEIPDIEVIYNQECYSLFGTSDDDPDSYFLSDVKDLDRPLSQFLSALRAVISEEIAPSDELLIRFDPLDLEFGERSNAKFLNRTFREILDCHSTLRRVPGVSADPVIILTVRRDSEEHFLEILADAERVKNCSPDADDSELSENADERSRTSALDVHDEASERADPGDYEDEGGDAAANHLQESGPLESEVALDHEDVAEEHEHEHVPQHSTSEREFVAEEHMEDPRSWEIHDTAEHVGDVPGEETLEAEEHTKEAPDEENLNTMEHFEDAPGDGTLDAENNVEEDNVEEAPDEETLDTSEHFEDAAGEVISNTEEHNGETPDGETFGSNEDLEVAPDEEVPDAEEHLENVPGESHSEDIGESGSWNEQTGDDSGVPQHPLEETDEHDYHMAEQHDDGSVEESAEVPGSSAVEAAVPEDGEPEHGADSNGYDSKSGEAPKLSGTSQQPALPAFGSNSTVKEQGFSEIVSPDDGDEVTRGGDLEHKASMSGSRAQSLASPRHGTIPKWVCASSSEPLCTSKALQPSNITVTVLSDANKLAYQDNDLILAFDDEPDPSTINEDADEDGEYAITYDATDTAPGEAERVRELATAATSGESAAVETASVHTSTTMDGDEEIDYNPEETADDAFAPRNDRSQQSVVPGVNHDEIDWENDEDEYEERLASQYASVDHEESKESVLASPGGSGKRSRTDEEESLADKTDHKRRRT